MLNKEQQKLVTALVAELNESNLAVFAGAGLSSGAGYVNWKELLRPIAADLDLDVELESDLVTLAQYHANANQANRAKLNQLLVTEFSEKGQMTENHQILARLPIGTYWTTNYDTLIETAVHAAGKVPDVKYTKKQLAYTKPKRDAVVYKMHGDVAHPAEAVLTRDDYEKYHVNMQPYITALSGDLVSKTFLFLGFSFTDPNLEYILSRVRVYYGQDQRQHHCILRRVSREEKESDADFEYRERKQSLFVQELLRVGIKTTFVTAYAEITEILRAVENSFKRRTIFISGAATEYGTWPADQAQQFIHGLSVDIAKLSYRVISGFGLGVGSAVITGVLEHTYMKGGRLDNDQLLLRPFPQSQPNGAPMKDLWTSYRKDMIQRAGIALFLFGNKLVSDKVELSGGMREEFELAKSYGLILIPVGATGYMAEELWREVITSFDESKYARGAEIHAMLQVLGDPKQTLVALRQGIVKVLQLLIH
jgi:hypothetical protein